MVNFSALVKAVKTRTEHSLRESSSGKSISFAFGKIGIVETRKLGGRSPSQEPAISASVAGTTKINEV